MANVGGSGVAEGLKSLRAAIKEYFAVLSSVKDGLPVKSMPKKPQALLMFDQCKAMGIPLIDGGLQDQPHIWLLEYAICQQERELNSIHQKAKNESTNSPQPQTVAATATADILRNVGRV